MIAFLTTLFFLYWKFLALYIVGGVVYSILKWVLMLVKLRRLVSDIEREGKTATEFDSARRSIAYQVFGQSQYPPTASKNKGNFLMWSVCWPINLIYTAFADIAKEAWLWIYKKIASLLDAIATAILPR